MSPTGGLLGDYDGLLTGSPSSFDPVAAIRRGSLNALIKVWHGDKVKIARMGWGEGPDTADRVFIHRIPGGQFSWSGSIGQGKTAIYTTGSGTFRMAADAEAAAIAWARSLFVAEVIIEIEDF